MLPIVVEGLLENGDVAAQIASLEVCSVRVRHRSDHRIAGRNVNNVLGVARRCQNQYQSERRHVSTFMSGGAPVKPARKSRRNLARSCSRDCWSSSNSSIKRKVSADLAVPLQLHDQPLLLRDKSLTLGHALFGFNKPPQKNSPFHRLAPPQSQRQTASGGHSA